jgi:hypothetical protein
MRRFKKGDKVRIKPFQKEWRHMGPHYTEEMSQYGGQIATIEGVHRNRYYGIHGYQWMDEWLEELVDLGEDLFEI